MHRNLRPADVLEECKKEGVTQVLPLFCDVLGHIKAHQIPIGQLEKVFKRGVVIDGSSIEGYARIEESDFRAIPDPTTFHVLPWTIGGEKTGLIICDVIEPDGRPFVGDPRFALKRMLEDTTKKGWTINIGPEAEFFYFKNAQGTEMLDLGGYYDLVPDSVGLDLRTQTIAALTALGIECEAGHHEVAPSQHEIDLKYRPALQMADIIAVHRWVVKKIAQQNGYYATFMPKPVAGENGSGMHVHLSIFEGDTNLFFDSGAKDAFHLSQVGRQFLAGILKYAPEITPITNPWVNSYKRLVPGFEAPVYLCWGSANRSALVRKPNYEPGHEEATRIEARFPDPSCNPYLAFACLIATGLAGIKEKLTPPNPVEMDVYHLTQSERSDLRIGSLPGDLDEALRIFEKSELSKAALGQHIFEKVIQNINAQLKKWRLAVTDFELKEYLPVM